MAANAPVDEESVLPPCCPHVTESTVICYNVRCENLYEAIMFAAFCLIGWAVLFSFCAPGSATPPRGQVFVLYSLLVASTVAGWIFSKIYLPPALAMMSVGMAYGNTGLFTSGVTVSRELIVNSRLAAITCVLVRAGLSVSAAAMKQYHWMIVRIGFLPMFSEMVAVTLGAHFLLDVSWLWSAILGPSYCCTTWLMPNDWSLEATHRVSLMEETPP